VADVAVLDHRSLSIPITLNGNVKRGELITHDGTNYVLADASDHLLMAELIALNEGVSADVIQATPFAVIFDSDAPFTAGAPIYLSETAGAPTSTKPTTAASATQRIGWAATTSIALIGLGGITMPPPSHWDNDEPLYLGDNQDAIFVLRSTTLAANTALTSVLLGTPVATAVAANSLLISNITADGDIQFYFNNGGNSITYMFLDASALVFHINDGGANLDTIIEGDTATTLFNLDAGQDAISLGGANVDGAALILNNLTDRTALTSVGFQLHFPAQTQNFDTANSTITSGSYIYIGRPTFTNDNATLTMTTSNTVYIENAPNNGSNVTGTVSWALFIDAGDVRIDGSIGASGSRVVKIWTTDQDTTNAENVSSWTALKNHVRDYKKTALDILSDIRVITFQHNDDVDDSGRVKLGIAAESISERLISYDKDYAEPYGKGPGIDTMGLATLNTKGIQELWTKVQRLTSQLTDAGLIPAV